MKPLRLTCVLLTIAGLVILAAGCPRQEEPTGFEQTADERGLTAQLTDEHQAVMALIDDMIGERDVAVRQQRLGQLRAALIPHMDGEEAAVYPAIQRIQSQMAPNQAAMAREEHQLVRTALQRLDINNDTQWDAELHMMRENIARHVDREEGVLFDAIEDAYEPEGLANLQRQYVSARQNALTRIYQQPGTSTMPYATPPDATTTTPRTPAGDTTPPYGTTTPRRPMDQTTTPQGSTTGQAY